MECATTPSNGLPITAGIEVTLRWNTKTVLERSLPGAVCCLRELVFHCSPWQFSSFTKTCPNALPTDNFGIALLIIAALPWVLPAVSEAEFPGGWKLKFREVAHEQRRQAEEIEWMKFLLRSFLSQYELDHLRKLGHPEPFLFDFNCATKKFFEKELRRLLDLDLIKRAPNKGVKGLLYEKEGIRKINNKEMKDVKDFSQITETGRDYLRMRDATI
jgi:hypothetical protein